MIIDLRGKGGRIRTVAVPIWVKQGINAWMTASQDRRGTAAPAGFILILSPENRGKMKDRGNALRRLLQRIRIEKNRASVHV